MSRFKGYRCLVAASAGAAFLAASAAADTIPLAGGWQADVQNPAHVSLTVDTVGADFIVVEVAKDFTEPPGVGGVFPPLLIDFQQIAPDENTVPRIIIADETITNQTGVPWTDFHWAVLNDGDAWFDVSDSMSFSVSPFTNKTFSDPGNVFGDPDRATDLAVDGGIVLPGQSFFPGGGPGNGDLVIATDLSGGDPLSFTLKEFPTPEPGSVLLLGLLGVWGLRRR